MTTQPEKRPRKATTSKSKSTSPRKATTHSTRRPYHASKGPTTRPSNSAHKKSTTGARKPGAPAKNIQLATKKITLKKLPEGQYDTGNKRLLLC